MTYSKITLLEALKMVNTFCPIKIIYNDKVLYNDYDSTVEIEKGIYGEALPLMAVVPNRAKDYANDIITSIEIEIVEHHHSVVTIKGE